MVVGVGIRNPKRTGTLPRNGIVVLSLPDRREIIA